MDDPLCDDSSMCPKRFCLNPPLNLFADASFVVGCIIFPIFANKSRPLFGLVNYVNTCSFYERAQRLAGSSDSLLHYLEEFLFVFYAHLIVNYSKMYDKLLRSLMRLDWISNL